MQRLQPSYQPTNTSRIVSLQFGIPSAEEIVQQSVVELASSAQFSRMTAPLALNGLFDAKMGVVKHGAYCPTDGNTYLQCPGYFGHLWLARPVYFTQYTKYIVKVLGLVCWNCSCSLVDQAKYGPLVLKHGRAKRMELVCSTAVPKAKRCPRCSVPQPKAWKEIKEVVGEIQPDWRPAGRRTSAAEAAAAAAARPDRVDPMIVYRILERIDDDTIDFIGMHSAFARPSSMVCRVLPIAPPAVRPSVEHDNGQRSEDDLTTMYVNVMKNNAQLAARIEAGAKADEVAKYLVLLQCSVGAIYANKFPGGSQITQSSGRPLQSIADRHDGKRGRARNNLNGKRVDFTARSVISGNPTIGVVELGVPLEMAMNLAVPVYVTARNRADMLALVRNGPDVWPGAKVVDHRGGGTSMRTVSLRNAMRESIVLEIGDVVHRHLQDGDIVGFNRQPSLHKSSFMAHRVRVMVTGQSFRLNLAATQTYNADFDGDEMNMHVPQTTAANNELLCLAIASEQMINPSENTPNLAFFQDNMLGLYLFSAEGIAFSLADAMELLGANSVLDVPRLLFGDDEGEEEEQQMEEAEEEEEEDATAAGQKRPRGLEEEQGQGQQTKKRRRSRLEEEVVQARRVTSREILGQTLPPITMRARAKNGDEVRLHRGRWLSGQADKVAVAEGSKGILHRICNDFGKEQCVQFIDNVQNLATAWITHHNSFSVGTGDLQLSPATLDRIDAVMDAAVRDVDALQTRFRLGLYENTSAWSNAAEFESQAWKILDGAKKEVEAAGVLGLARNNRFLEMVHAGSKGKMSNITQMAMGLCQQAISGARAPYGFTDRTLPMYTKYDDGAVARGFLTRSYVRGLLPAGMFIHAIAGREGLIDTAIKTSQTGYIARRLRMSLEIATTQYGFTVRDHSRRLVQFRYGDDGFSAEAGEAQSLPLVSMDLGDLAMRYDLPLWGVGRLPAFVQMFTPEAAARLGAQEEETRRRCKDAAAYLAEARDAIVRHVFRFRGGSTVHLPVNFAAILAEVGGQMQLEHRLLDLTPLEAMQLVEELDDKLVQIHCGFRNPLFTACLHFWLNPKELLLEQRFHRAALVQVLALVELRFKQALQPAGEPVGVLAAQCITEPATQMTLNTFHSTGMVTAKNNVTHGVPRLDELLSLTENTKKPALTLRLLPADERSRERAMEIAHQIECLTLGAVVSVAQIVYDPNDRQSQIAADVDWLREFHAFQEEFSAFGARDRAADDDEDAELLRRWGGRDAAAALDTTMSNWVLRLELDARAMLDKNVSMDDVQDAVASYFEGDGVEIAYADFNHSQLVLRVRTLALVSSGRANQAGLDTSEHLNYLKRALESLLKNVVLRGVFGIVSVTPRKLTNQVFREDGAYVRRDVWVLDTEGSNLAGVLALEDLVDVRRVQCNDVREVQLTLGLECARSTLLSEFAEVMGDVEINYHHLSLLVDRTCMTANMVAAVHGGLNSDDTGPLAKMSFERHSKMGIEAAVHGQNDNMRGVTANIMCGQPGLFGTGACNVLVDVDAFARHAVHDDEDRSSSRAVDDDDDVDVDVGAPMDVESGLAALSEQHTACQNVEIVNNLSASRVPDAVPQGCLDDGYKMF